MTSNDPFVVIAGYRVVIDVWVTKNFNFENPQKRVDAVGILLRIWGELVLGSWFLVLGSQRDGEDDSVDHDQPVRHATDRRTVAGSRDALRFVLADERQGDGLRYRRTGAYTIASDRAADRLLRSITGNSRPIETDQDRP